MNEQKTIELMGQLRLKAMAELYSRSLKENLYRDHTADELLSLMLQTEWENRQQDKIASLTKRAAFKELVSSQNIDYHNNRRLDKGMFERLLGLGFIEKKENVIITGPTGVGKSYLAQAIGIKACNRLHKTLFFTTSDFFDLAKLKRLEGTYLRWSRMLAKVPLLVLDDFAATPIDAPSRQLLMEIVDKRYEKCSVIITSQIPVAGWHERIGEPTLADAILDRLVYSSHRIELDGESLRKMKKLST